MSFFLICFSFLPNPYWRSPLTVTAFFLSLLLLYSVWRWLLKPGFGLVKAWLSYAWHHKVLSLVVVALFVLSTFISNPNNSLTFHDGIPGVIGYILVGFANLFYGILMGFGQLAENLSKVPEEVGDIGGIMNIGGYILAYALYSVKAIANAFVFWMSVYILRPETLWNGIIIVCAIIALGGGANGVIGAAMKKGSGGGGHAAKPSGGSGHH